MNEKQWTLIQMTTGPEPIRADQALLLALRSRGLDVSRSLVKKLFGNQEVILDQRALPGSALLSPGAHEIQIPSELLTTRQSQPATKNLSIEIIYEDQNLVVINKPRGMPSAPIRSSERETAVNFLLARNPELSQVDEKEAGLVHRLDTLTSGLLVFAKTPEEFHRLTKLWKDRKVRKIYRAITYLKNDPPALLPHSITWSMAHDPKSKKRMIAVPSGQETRKYRGKLIPADTQILNIHQFYQLQDQPLADFEIEIKTGVMHQIRCHLSASGWPIVGDPVYFPKIPADFRLHAWKLELPIIGCRGYQGHRGSQEGQGEHANERLILEAPLPSYWTENCC